MQRLFIFLTSVICFFCLSSYAQAGARDLKARAIIKLKWPNATHWKCHKISSISSKDFIEASSFTFLGKSFTTSILKEIISEDTNLVFAELIADHGNFHKTNIHGPTDGPGYEARYNIFVVTGEVPNTSYFWTPASSMNYGSGLGYITFKGGKPLFVDAKHMYPYGDVRENTLKELKECTFWIRIMPLNHSLYEADPPTSDERKVSIRENRHLEEARNSIKESNSEQGSKNHNDSKSNNIGEKKQTPKIEASAKKIDNNKTEDISDIARWLRNPDISAAESLVNEMESLQLQFSRIPHPSPEGAAIMKRMDGVALQIRNHAEVALRRDSSNLLAHLWITRDIIRTMENNKDRISSASIQALHTEAIAHAEKIIGYQGIEEYRGIPLKFWGHSTKSEACRLAHYRMLLPINELHNVYNAYEKDINAWIRSGKPLRSADKLKQTIRAWRQYYRI